MYLLIEIAFPSLLHTQALDLPTEPTRNNRNVGAVIVSRDESRFAADVGGLEDSGGAGVASLKRSLTSVQ